MNILLVNPSSPGIYEWAGVKLPPLGLAYLASVLREDGHGVRITDLQVERPDILNQKIAQCDLVGITSESNKVFRALDIARLARQKGKKVVMGGYHATFRDQEILLSSIVDYVVKGEGEYTFRELIRRLENGKAISDIPGVSLLFNGRFHTNPIPPPPDDLDALPLPARDLLPLSKYWMTQIDGEPLLNVVTSRGCPHACSFCASSSFAGRKWRTRSPENIVKELEQLYFDYGFRGFAFMDDNFTLRPERVEAITNSIKKRGMNMKWWCFSRVDTLLKNASLVQNMASAGLRMVYLGLESADPRALKAYGKRITTEVSKLAVELLHSHGVKVLGSFILGNINDTRTSVMKTIDYAKGLNLDLAQFSALTPFPGTRLFQEATRDNRLTSVNWNLFDGGHPVLRGDHLHPRELHKLIVKAYLNFYRQGKQAGNVFGFLRKFASTRIPPLRFFKEVSYRRKRIRNAAEAGQTVSL